MVQVHVSPLNIKVFKLKYPKINKNLFIENRKKIIKKIKPNSLILINSNYTMPTNEDGNMPFKQNSDMFYLSGINQEKTTLIIYPDAKEESYKEILFIEKIDKEKIIWEGNKCTKKEAYNISGIKTCLWIENFENIFKKLMNDTEYVYLNTNEHPRASIDIESKDSKFIKWCKNKYPLHKYERIAPIIHNLRKIKSKYEIELIKKACKITEMGIKRIIPIIKPGIMEYEIEAELIHEFIRLRSNGFSFNPIIASGKNSCILHYLNNNKKCKSGEIVLVDVGTDYSNYSSDITRVFPVNGRFTKRQKNVYNSVLKIIKKAKKIINSNKCINNYNKEILETIKEELIKLKLINIKKKNIEYKKYFMHGITHHLGISTHDVGNMNNKFEEGMVFTIEPGIYIKNENIGIRLENDITIKNNKIEDISGNIPIEIEEIEYMMNKPK